MRAITIPRHLQITLLTVYETLSEVKQSRRNKLEVGRAGSPPRWSMIKHQCQCFFSVLWQPLTAWCLGFFIRKRKEGGMDPKQRGFHKQYSPNDFMWADTVLSGYQDNTIFFFLLATTACCSDSQSWDVRGIPEHSNKFSKGSGWPHCFFPIRKCPEQS